MKKQRSNNELAFSSPFTLHNCISRLRSLSKRREWMFTIIPQGDDVYYFTMSGKRHSAAVGYFYRQASNTLVTIKQERNWLLFGLLGLMVLAVGFIDIVTVVNYFRQIFASPTRYLVGPYLFQVTVVLSIEMFITFHLARLVWRIYKGAAHIAQAIERSLTDAITDLPQTDHFTHEDGELLVIDDDDFGDYDFKDEHSRRYS